MRDDALLRWEYLGLRDDIDKLDTAPARTR